MIVDAGAERVDVEAVGDDRRDDPSGDHYQYDPADPRRTPAHPLAERQHAHRRQTIAESPHQVSINDLPDS